MSRNKTIILLKKLLFFQIFCKWLFWSWKMGRLQYIHILNTKHSNKFNDLYMDWEERTEDRGGKKKGWKEEETAFWISQATQRVFENSAILPLISGHFLRWCLVVLSAKQEGHLTASSLKTGGTIRALLIPPGSFKLRCCQIPIPQENSSTFLSELLWSSFTVSLFFTLSLAVEFEMNLTPI